MTRHGISVEREWPGNILGYRMRQIVAERLKPSREKIYVCEEFAGHVPIPITFRAFVLGSTQLVSKG